MRARVRACVCVCLSFLYYIFSSWYVFYFVIYKLSDTFNFTCPPSRWQCQYRSCSRFPTQDQSPLAHVLPLWRSSLTRIHALLTKHAQCTSKSSSWTLFCSRPFGCPLFGLVSLHQPLNCTLASVEVISFAWFSDIASPSSFSCLQKLWIFCICTASVWCLLCVE